MRPRRLRISVVALLAAFAFAAASPPRASAADSSLINTAQVKHDAHAFGHAVQRDSRDFGHRVAISARQVGRRVDVDARQASHAVQRWWTGFKASVARARTPATHNHSA